MFLWSDHPNMHIKTYVIELNKRQCAMVKLNVPCDDALKVITYVNNMHKSGIFKERELLKWENNSNLQGWTETQTFFDNIGPTKRRSTSALKGRAHTRAQWQSQPPPNRRRTLNRPCTSSTPSKGRTWR